MRWMVFSHKWILVVVIFCLIGTISQACEDYEQEEKCDSEVETEEITVESEVTPNEEIQSSITDSKWFIILEKLIERYPIIERIIERIFQWIFNNLLGLDY
jgi:hypothetical protein